MANRDRTSKMIQASPDSASTRSVWLQNDTNGDIQNTTTNATISDNTNTNTTTTTTTTTTITTTSDYKGINS